MDLCRFGLSALLLSLLVGGIIPRESQAQDADTHGAVTQVSGDQVVVQLDESVSLPDTARGRVLVQGEEKAEVVAEINVQSVSGTLVVGRVAERRDGRSLQAKQRVVFPVLRDGPPSGDAATLTVESTPKEATVRLLSDRNGRKLGTTPTIVKLPPGSHRLRFNKSGFIPLERVVTVRTDTIQDVRVSLRALERNKVARKGTLSVRPSPDSAMVSVDGNKKGTGDTQAAVSAGTHRIRATAPGFIPKAESLSVAEGERRRVTLELSQKTDTFRVASTPTQAVVSIDGEEIGRTPLTTAQPIGPHTISVEKSGYETAKRSVTVSKDTKETLQFALRRPINVELADQQGEPVQSAQLTREESEVMIQYALPSEEESFEVEVQLSMNGGNTYQKVPDDVVSGDVGDDVSGGTDKRIRWDVLQQYSGGLTGNQNRVRVVAEEATPSNYPGWPSFVVEASLTPTVTSGTGLGNTDGGGAVRAGYAAEDFGLFVIGFKASAGSINMWGVGPELNVELAEQGTDWPVGWHTRIGYLFTQSNSSTDRTFRSGERLRQSVSATAHVVSWGQRIHYTLSLGDYVEFVPMVTWTTLQYTGYVSESEESGLYELEKFASGSTITFSGPLRGGLGLFLGSEDFGVYVEAEKWLTSSSMIGLHAGLRF